MAEDDEAPDDIELEARVNAAAFNLLNELIDVGREMSPAERFQHALDDYMAPIETNVGLLLIWLEAEKALGGDTVMFFATHLHQKLDRLSAQIEAVAKKIIDPDGYLDGPTD